MTNCALICQSRKVAAKVLSRFLSCEWSGIIALQIALLIPSLIQSIAVILPSIKTREDLLPFYWDPHRNSGSDACVAFLTKLKIGFPTFRHFPTSISAPYYTPNGPGFVGIQNTKPLKSPNRKSAKVDSSCEGSHHLATLSISI